MWRPWRLREVTVTPDGIAIGRPWWRGRSIRWAGVTECHLATRTKVRRSLSGRIRLRNVYVLTIRRRFGLRTRLRMATPATVTGYGDFVTTGPYWPEHAEHVRLAAQAIAVSFARFHLAGVLRRLRDGAEVDFGAFTATPDGLRHRGRYGHRVRPWQELASAGATGTVDLQTLRSGRETFTVHAPLDVAMMSWGQDEHRSRVRNHTTLSLLVEVLKGGASFSQALQTLNDAPQPGQGWAARQGAAETAAHAGGDDAGAREEPAHDRRRESSGDGAPGPRPSPARGQPRRRSRRQRRHR
ncbi:hypothetical protein DP939_45155 [Spongiactinospora rosea]|uniref:Uncharacterized protein n=1 Tax=Spongiactinospora rosea TaxID=2248750 RepID=A0A366LCV6_9ACTN|nr:hypothetical protein DP939_45155 [Spongiactinospora rosea]